MKLSRFTISATLTLLASILAGISLVSPILFPEVGTLGLAPTLIEFLALWVLVVLTIRTYLQDTAPLADVDALINAGWKPVESQEEEDPYLVYLRGREVLTIHAEDFQFVNYSDGDHYWKDEDIRGDVEKRILTPTPHDLADTHTHIGAQTVPETPGPSPSPGAPPTPEVQETPSPVDTHTDTHTHIGAQTVPETPQNPETDSGMMIEQNVRTNENKKTEKKEYKNTPKNMRERKEKINEEPTK